MAKFLQIWSHYFQYLVESFSVFLNTASFSFRFESPIQCTNPVDGLFIKFPMTGFEPRTSCAESERSSNCTTTTAPKSFRVLKSLKLQNVQGISKIAFFEGGGLLLWIHSLCHKTRERKIENQIIEL